jgi:glycosyltransferase involved in cell wall biosynthesis
VRVTLVTTAGEGASGIGRYVEQLRRALAECSVEALATGFRYLPGAKWRPVLKAFPTGVEAPHGGIVHLTQIMGASMLLLRRPGPTVVTVHDLGALYCPEDQLTITPLDRQLLRLSLLGMRRADHIIAVSEFTRGHLIRAGYQPERITTVHEGVDGNVFRPRPGAAQELARRYGIGQSADRPIVLYVGSELRRKNLETLVRALGRLRRAGVPFCWVKVGASGDAAGRAQLRQQIVDEGLANDVTLIDRVPEEDLPLFYAAASVYVQPSVWEGFGLPVLEAMACGTPVVAASAGALPEVCGVAASLVDPRDAAEMAGAIGQVLHDVPTRERMGDAGRRRAGAFGWAETAAKTRAVYEALIA